MQEITLKHPIDAGGKKLKKVKLDFDALVVGDFIKASQIAHPPEEMNVVVAVELDTNYHIALAQLAITKAMPELDILDTKRIRGYDVVELMEAGRNFFIASGAEDGQEAPAEESSPSLA